MYVFWHKCVYAPFLQSYVPLHAGFLLFVCVKVDVKTVCVFIHHVLVVVHSVLPAQRIHAQK